jgi:hypothetical protein
MCFLSRMSVRFVQANYCTAIKAPNLTCYYNYTLPRLLLKTQRFGEWILSPPSSGTYTVVPLES